jgi:hypothetical protein
MKKANIAIRKLVLETSNLKQPHVRIILCAALENKGLLILEIKSRHPIFNIDTGAIKVPYFDELQPHFEF